VVKENTMKNLLGTTDNLQLFDKENRLVYEFIKSSNGFSYERTYDSNGKELTYKDSNGVTRGFDIPEYTMEELVEKIGNFKIKK
jgi:hypothetical protein